MAAVQTIQLKVNESKLEDKIALWLQIDAVATYLIARKNIKYDEAQYMLATCGSDIIDDKVTLRIRFLKD